MQTYYFIETLNGQIKTIKATDDKDFEENFQRISSRKKVVFYSTSRKDISKFIAEELKRLEKEKEASIPPEVTQFCKKIHCEDLWRQFKVGTLNASHIKPYVVHSYMETGRDTFEFLERNQLEDFIASDVLAGYQVSIFSFPEGNQIKFDVEVIVRVNDNQPAKKEDWFESL